MDEFALIRRFFTDELDERVELGIGDDAALLRWPPGARVVITTDTLLAGRHFPEDTPAFSIGWKSLAVSLSDLAAMGAMPQAYVLALTLPAVNAAWLDDFARGLQAVAAVSGGIARVGGDTCAGPLAITITALGSLAADASAMRRDGARPGDAIAVTGSLGDAALALARLQAGLSCPQALRERLDQPVPRIAAGQALRVHAHAAIDVSDGLAGDLMHILEASGVGADIDVERLPASEMFTRLAPASERLRLQVSGGDDYELCVCLPAEALPGDAAGTPLQVIGTISGEPGLRWRDGQGRLLSESLHGFRHF
jgi:thiamine-monophosphate kinase